MAKQLKSADSFEKANLDLCCIQELRGSEMQGIYESLLLNSTVLTSSLYANDTHIKMLLL